MRIRGLTELSGAERGWFQPGLDCLNTLPHFFAPDDPVWLARAPGRLDVMGGIADYSGAQVLELPLDRSTVVTVQRQASPRADLQTRRAGRWESFGMELAPLLAGESADPLTVRSRLGESSHGTWAAYLLGVIQYCLALPELSAADTRPGFRLLVDSTLPEGKGVASSAAFEVAGMFAVLASCRAEVSAPELATACQWVENHVVGAPCGIMDQLTSACGLENRLLLLRCQPGSIEGQIGIPAGYRFFGIDSGIRHDVSSVGYGTVRTAAFMGYRMIAETAGLPVTRRGAEVRIDDPRWNGYLANLSPEEFSARFETVLPESMTGAEFLARFGGITDPVTRVHADRSYPVRQATAHPVREQARVARFVELLRRLPEDSTLASELGVLMYASHWSYGDCGLGSSGTDRLVELARAAGPAEGVYGAKITGGGSGGTVAVFGSGDAGDAVKAIAERYAAETGRAVELFERSGPGAEATGVLRLDSPRDR